MPSQEITLSDFFVEGRWSGSVLLDPLLVAGGGVAYLRVFDRVGTAVRVKLSASPEENPDVEGPDFTDAIEVEDAAFTFISSAGNVLILKGPIHDDVSFPDPNASEVYFWVPDNSAAWFDYIDDHVDGEDGETNDDATLVIFDGDAGPDDFEVAAEITAPTAIITAEATLKLIPLVAEAEVVAPTAIITAEATLTPDNFSAAAEVTAPTAVVTAQAELSLLNLVAAASLVAPVATITARAIIAGQLIVAAEIEAPVATISAKAEVLIPDVTLSSLTISGLALNFNPAQELYIFNVPGEVEELLITPILSDPTANYNILIEGVVNPSNMVMLVTGLNTVTIRIFASNNITNKTYTLRITRLASFTVLGDTLVDRPVYNTREWDRGIYVTSVERALDRIYRYRTETMVDYPKWDVDNTPPAFLPYLAYERAADAYTDILDLDRERRIIKGAWELNILRGTPASLTRLGEIACFAISYTDVRADVAGINKVIGIKVRVSPCGNVVNTDAWASYVKRVITALLPVFIDLLEFSISNNGLGDVYYGGAIKPTEFLVFQGVTA